MDVCDLDDGLQHMLVFIWCNDLVPRKIM